MDAKLTLTIDKEVNITPRIRKMIGQLKVLKKFDYKEELTDTLVTHLAHSPLERGMILVLKRN